MNDIGRWSLKAFAPNISRRSLLDKVAVVSNRKPCGVWEFNHSTSVRWLPIPGGLSRPWWYGKQCRGLYSGGLSLYDSSPHQQKSGLTEKDYCTFRSHGLWTGRSYQPAGILISCLYRDGLTHFQPHYLTIDQLTSIWGGCCTKKSSSYGILQFSHPKKIQVVWRAVHVCWLSRQSTVFRQLSHWPFHFDGTSPPSSQRGMWNAVTLGDSCISQQWRRSSPSPQLPAAHQGIVWPPWHGAAVPSLVACCRMLRTTGVLANQKLVPLDPFWRQLELRRKDFINPSYHLHPFCHIDLPGMWWHQVWWTLSEFLGVDNLGFPWISYSKFGQPLSFLLRFA